MLSRREIFGCSGAALILKSVGCGGGPVYEFQVRPSEDGLSVWTATARHWPVGVDANPSYLQHFGSPKVTHLDGFQSEGWVFEIDHRRYQGRLDSASSTRLWRGQVVTWLETD